MRIPIYRVTVNGTSELILFRKIRKRLDWQYSTFSHKNNPAYLAKDYLMSVCGVSMSECLCLSILSFLSEPTHHIYDHVLAFNPHKFSKYKLKFRIYGVETSPSQKQRCVWWWLVSFKLISFVRTTLSLTWESRLLYYPHYAYRGLYNYIYQRGESHFVQINLIYIIFFFRLLCRISRVVQWI